jgi:DNA-binding MarR family transcriptional regulator
VESTYNVTESLLRLVRVMRRRPAESGHQSRGSRKLMRILAAHSGASSRELADMMDIRPSSLTEMLNKLEESGLVVRTRDEKDMRVVRVSISELGAEELKRHKEAKRQYIDILAEGLDVAEQKVFCELCDRLAERAEKQSGELQLGRGKHDLQH